MQTQCFIPILMNRYLNARNMVNHCIMTQRKFSLFGMFLSIFISSYFVSTADRIATVHGF